MTTSGCSVIILSYNTKNLTRDCLNHALLSVKSAQLSGYNCEIIVVDNASTDGSPEMIKKEFPQVHLLAQKNNLGFTGGNNLGMKKASKDLFLLLNSDAFLEQDTLIRAIEIMNNHPHWGVMGCKLVYADGSFQPSGGYLPTPTSVVQWMMGLDLVPGLQRLLHPVHPNWPEFFSSEKQMGWVMGAFMCLRRQVWEKTDGFDEHFFMYMEEVEWCKRIADAGYGVGFTPAFSVVHLGKASSASDPVKPYVKEAQGLLYYIKKHYPKSLPLVRSSIVWGNRFRLVAFQLLGRSHRAQASRAILNQI